MFKSQNLQKDIISLNRPNQGGNAYDFKEAPKSYLYYSAMRCGDNRDNG